MEQQIIANLLSTAGARTGRRPRVGGLRATERRHLPTADPAPSDDGAGPAATRHVQPRRSESARWVVSRARSTLTAHRTRRGAAGRGMCEPYPGTYGLGAMDVSA